MSLSLPGLLENRLTGKVNTLLYVILLSFFFVGEVEGATRYSVNSGNWASTSTWSSSSGGNSGASVPVAGDIVYIEGNKTVTIAANAACASVNIASGSTLTIGGNTFTVSGTTTVSGTFSCSATAGSKTMGNVVMSGGTWTSSAGETYAITALTLSGSTFGGTATGTFTVSSTLTVTAGTTNTFNASTFTVTGTTTVNGVLNFASNTGTKTFIGAVSVSAGGTWNNTGNSAFTLRGGLTNNGTFNSGTGIYTFNTNSQGLAGTLSIASITVTGVTVTNNGILYVTNALSGTGGLTNAANATLHLDYSGAVSITTLTANASGNTIDYGYAGTQTIRAITYANLSLSGSSTKTLGGNTVIQEDLTISGTDGVNSCTFNPSSYNLTVTGFSTINNLGIFNDNNNTGVNTFTGALSLNGTGTWISTSVTTPANLIFQGGITHNGTVDFTAYAATFSASQTLSLTSSGNLTFNTGASAVSSVAVNANLILQASGTGDFQFYGAGSFTIAATVTVTNKSFVDFQQVMVGSNASTSIWLNDVNSTLSYQNTIGPLVTGTLTATASGNTVDYDGTGSQTVKDGSYHHLTLSASRTSNTITIGTISIAGSFSKTATFTSGTGVTATSVTYNGSTAQAILATDDDFTYSNLIINNSAGVTLNGNTLVNGTLTFTNGRLTTGSYALILGNSASISGAGTGKYVFGNLTIGIAASTSTKTFEIGDALYYSPVTLAFTGTTNGSGSITASTTSGNHPNVNTSTLNASLAVNQYWTISNSGVTGISSYSATFTFDAADIDPGADYNSFIVAKYSGGSWSYPETGTTASTNTQALGLTGFGDFQIGESLYATTACQYDDNGNSPTIADVLPCINMSSNPQTISSTFACHQYFTMNVIAGLTYQIYTCNSSAPSNALKMAVYREGVPADPYIAFSYSNSGNPCTSVSNNVYLSFTATFSGQVRVLINRKSDCGATTPSGLTVKVNVSGGSNTQDTQTDAGTNTWIGHIYDGTNSGVAYNGTFTNYLGYHTESETFMESYGGNTNCFNAVFSDGVVRASVYTDTYSVRYRMNSTRSGLYVVDLGSDDGGRLAVDGNLVYNNWADQSYSSKPRVLISLDGNSSLVYDFYENGGANQVGFQNLTLVLANLLSTNTNQSVCLGSSGSAISGDSYGTLPTGISLSGTGYQWTYSTTPAGTRTTISGATSATYTPNTAVAPFNTAGTYYIYRNAVLSSVNNVSPNPYVGTHESNAAVLIVNPALPVSVSISASATTICAGSSVTFTATPTNGGSSPVYQWKLNGSNVGTNSSTYSNSALANNDVVSCVLTSNASCATGSPATSNSITMTVNPVLTAGISISASATTICSGSSVTFTATPTNGGSGPIYQWKLNGSNVGTNSTTYTNSSLSNGNTVSCVITSNATCVTGSPATSNTVTMTVNPNLPVSVSISSSATTICSGTSVTLTATPTNGGSSPTYQWKVNGSNVGTSSSTYTSTALANNDVVTCVLTSNATCATGSPATSNPVSMTVNPNLPVSVSISASATTICSGTSVTFTATPTNGGSTPGYQWKLNGANVGTNSATYSSSSLANGNVITCVMTSNATCATGSPATSNPVTMTVNPNLPVSVSVSASATTICSGTSVSFTATPTNGGSSPVYQWKLNGSNVGTSTSTYSNSSLSNNDVVTCVLTSNASCATGSPATSNAVTMTVNPNLPVSVSISASATTICSGTSVTFTATPTNGGSSPSYQWKRNGSNVGTNSNTYSNSSLSNGDVILCVLTSNATCATGSPATSNSVTITVNPILTASVSIAASSNPICAGTVVTFTATPTNGGSSPIYLWKVNGVNVGANSSSYSTGSLANNDVVTCVLTSNAACVTGSPATSNAVTMTVNPLLTAGVSISASSTSICSGTSVTFTATPANGGSSPGYQWKVDGSNVGTNSATYTSSALVNGNVVSCVMTSNASCVSGSPATSNSVTMTVTSNLPVSVNISASANPICSGNSVTFTATPSNGGASPTYQWKLNGANVGSNSATYSNSALVSNDIISCVLTSSLGCTSGNPATSNSVTMTVNPNLPASVSIASSATTICAGTSVTFTATPVNGGSSPIYQWIVNGGQAGTNNATFTTTALSNNDVVSCVLTSNATCATGSPATSNPITMTVNPIMPVSISISASSNPVCTGTSVTFTAIPVNGGTTPSYQWQVNGVNVGTSSTTYTSSSLVNGDVVSCILTSNVSCPSGNPALSNAITMTVNPNLPVTVSISASSTTICSGSSVTLTAIPVNGGSAPTYQWKLNGANTGTNSASYTTSSLLNNDVVSCVLTSNATCATGNPATSNSVAMTVTAISPVSVSISSDAGSTICSGSNVTFTATPVNGGTSPTYQWKKNGVNVGTSSITYTDASLSDQDVISCILTSSLTCTSGNPSISNSILMTVTAMPTVPTAISSTPASYNSDYTGTIDLIASGGGASGAVLTWYTGGCGSGSTIGTGSPLTIQAPGSTTTYYARWENGSCFSGCVSVTVTVNKNYRSKATGDWGLASTWEVYSNGSWNAASTTPTSTDGTITLRSPYVVTVSTTTGYINVDEVTIDQGGKLVVNVCPSNWWFNVVNGSGTDLTINGTMEYQDDQVSLATGATIAVGSGGLFQQNLSYSGNYPITIPTATWDANSTYEVLSSNQLAPKAGLSQSFGNFTWNYSGQTADINLAGALTTVNGNFTLASSGTKTLALTATTALTLNIGKDLIIQNGILDFSTGAAATKVLTLGGNYTQTNGTFKNTNSTVLSILLTGNEKTFTQSGGTLTSTYMNWTVNSGAYYTLNNSLTVPSGRSFTLNGTLDCRVSNSINGAGSFVMASGARLIMGSPFGITSTSGTGNIQTTTATITSNGDFVYNGSASQVTGNRLPSVLRDLTVQNSAGVTLSGSATLNGILYLNAGNLAIGDNTLTFQNTDVPIQVSSGNITTSSGSSLVFGTAGNTGGAAFTLPDGLFSSSPTLNNLTINRVNSLMLNNQLMSIRGVVLCNGPLNTNDNLLLLSSDSQTALIDGAGTGTISGLVTMQRYLSSGYGYKYLSTPFQSTTVSAFAPYVNLAASFPTFYRYDENRDASGWLSFTDPSNSLTPMLGYAANLGSSASAVTLSLSGQVNNNLSAPITLYNHNKTYTQGFSLVGNPYPSPINWNAANGWTKTRIDNALYYFNAGSTDSYTGTYSTYINGISSDGIASNIIPAMQGFFVHVTNGSFPVTGYLGMDNRVRVNNLTPVFHKEALVETRPLIRLSAAYKGDQLADPTVVYIEDYASGSFDSERDAMKLLNTDQRVPSIFSLTEDGERLSIQAIDFPVDSLEIIPLGFYGEKDGWVEFTTSSIENFPSGLKAFLVDSLTGSCNLLASNESYSAYLSSGEVLNRFAIVFSFKELEHNPPITDVFKVYNVDNTLHLFMDLSEGMKATLIVSNMLGQSLLKQELFGNGLHEVQHDLPPGVYLVSLYTSKGISSTKLYISR